MTARVIKFIDTHSHLQVERLDGHRAQWLAQAREAGLENILLCAGAPEDWERTLSTAHEWGLGAMLGIHPLWLDSTTPAELVGLRELAASLLDDPHFIGLGEVGLDGFEPGLDQHKAEQVFTKNLRSPATSTFRSLFMFAGQLQRRSDCCEESTVRRAKRGFSPCAAPSMPLTARMLNARLF